MVRRSTFNSRLDPEVKAAAEKAAVMDGRTLTDLVERLLVKHCQEAGTLPEGWMTPKGRRKP